RPPRPRPSSRPTRSAARSPAAPHETAPAVPVNASAGATPDPPPTVAACPLAAQASACCRAPSQTSILGVLRRPVEFTLAAAIGVKDDTVDVAAAGGGGHAQR